MSDHFNQLTEAEAERLAVLSEECGELIQAIGKIQRHGYDSRHPAGGPWNREILTSEAGDVLAAVELLIVNDDLDRKATYAAATKKAQRLKRWLHHSHVLPVGVAR